MLEGEQTGTEPVMERGSEEARWRTDEFQGVGRLPSTQEGTILLCAVSFLV